jgi:hypothetical protein
MSPFVFPCWDVYQVLENRLALVEMLSYPEVSGTEVSAELTRRHREKVAQARDNPFGWEACVAVCAFSPAGHRVRFSKHSIEEAERVESQD